MTMTQRYLRRCGGAVVLVLALGCDSPAPPASSEGPAASSSGGTTGTSGGGDAGGSTGTSGGVEPNPQPTTGTAEAFECNHWTQNCPAGQKCNLYSQGGDQDIDAAKCVPLVDPPRKLEETCTTEGGFGSGLDDCDAGLICWANGPNDMGRCYPTCQGLKDDPLCPEGWLCASGGGNFFDLCLPPCDPLAQDCIEGNGCYSSEHGFVCGPDISGSEGQLHDPCTSANDCDPGMLCGPPSVAPECGPDGPVGCCTPLCELGGGACPPGSECVAYDDPPDPKLPSLGFCVVP